MLSEENVLKALNSLNPEKSPGPDYVYPRVLYEAKKELVKPLLILFNQSLSEGVIPEDWRKAIVSPILKMEVRKSQQTTAQ